MKLSTFRQKIADGYSVDWLIDDKTMEQLSMFDCLNIAQCAANRAKQWAGVDSQQFGANYDTARLWADFAADYCF